MNAGQVSWLFLPSGVGWGAGDSPFPVGSQSAFWRDEVARTSGYCHVARGLALDSGKVLRFGDLLLLLSVYPGPELR